MSKKWTAEAVVSAIKNYSEKGMALDGVSMQTVDSNLLNAGKRLYGKWSIAVETAGIDYAVVRRVKPGYETWNERLVIEAVKKLHNQGHPLDAKSVRTNKPKLFKAALKYCGGWAQAVIAAGFDYKQIRLRHSPNDWSKDSIVDAIIARIQNGKPVHLSCVVKDDVSLYAAAKYHFGRQGWAKARVLAGLNPTGPDPRVIWTEDSICKEILRLSENGVPLNTGALTDSDYYYILSAGRKVFGTWENAVNAAGLDYAGVRVNSPLLTKEEVLAEIMRLEAQNVRLNSQNIQKSYGALMTAAQTWFGCWSEAVETAGIQYRLHCRRWSTKAWLRRMRSDEYTSILETSRAFARKRRKI